MYIKNEKIDTIKSRAVTEMLAEGAAAVGCTGARPDGGAGVEGDCLIILFITLFCHPKYCIFLSIYLLIYIYASPTQKQNLREDVLQ